MKRRPNGVSLLLLLLVSTLWAVEVHYQTGKFVSVDQKTRSRILYYQVDTPVTKDDPYWEVSVQIKDTVYVGEYSPRHAAEAPPEEWMVPQAEVKVRLEKHYMFLVRPSGRELQFMITKRTPASLSDKTPEAPSSK
jgi:hypothetical protein